MASVEGLAFLVIEGTHFDEEGLPKGSCQAWHLPGGPLYKGVI